MPKNNESLVPMNYKEMNDFAKIVLKSQMFHSIKSAEQCLLTMMAGKEMGMGFIEACNSIYLVNGKVSLFYPKVGELIKRSGKYDYKIKEHDNQKCVISFKQLSLDGTKWEEIGESAFTMEDAKTAKLSGDNWSKYPRNMLFARALTNGARFHTPDVFGGAIYEPEELGARIEYAEDGETVSKIQVPSSASSQNVPEPSQPALKDNETEIEIEVSETSTEPDDVKQSNGLLKLEVDISASKPLVKVMKTADLVISSWNELESQRTPGVKYGKVTFSTNYELPEGVVAMWPEFTVAPYVFDKLPDLYRALEKGDLVIAKLSFETKKTEQGDRHYQNVEILMKYPPNRNEKREDIGWKV